MGKKNDAIVPFLKDKVRFSDLINGTMFNGEQIISPDELELLNSESGIILKDKNNKNSAVKRYRDIVMSWRKNVTFAVLACEVQENVHYAMPVRNMFYDSLSYAEQIENKWRNLKMDEKINLTGTEFLSHFRKRDKIKPVLTFVFFYGDEWDGNLELYDMLEWDEETNKEILHKYIPNYRINLINPTKLQDLSVFKSDLQLIFGMLKYKDDKEKLFNFTKDNSNYFESVSTQTAYAIGAFLNYDKLLDKILEKDEKEEQDMCKALEDLYNDGVAEGELKGRLEGKQETLKNTVTLLKSLNMSEEEIRQNLIEYFGYDESLVL